MAPSSSLVPSLANAPVLSVGPPYACQSSLLILCKQEILGRVGILVLEAQRDVTHALWAQYGPTTTSVRSVNPISQPYRDFSGHSGDGVTAGQSGDGGRSSQDASGVGGSGQGRDATYGLPPNWDWNIPPPHPPQAQGVDPVLAGLMQQQLQLGQTLIDVMRRGNQPQQPQQPQQPPVGVPERERLTMDTKWIPAMPPPSFKQWVSRSRELSGFRDWAEKLGGWLALIHDQYGPELREALRMEEPIVLRGADQELRARRLFHLIQQAFTGYPKIEHMIRNQIMARGAADANVYELFRLIRREFSIYSRQEALYYRELVLKFTVKKPSIDGLIDVLREIQTEIESFHSMLEASVMARALVDLRINEGDQFSLYLRNLPEKVAEHVQLISGAGTVQQLWRAVTEYYIRSRATGTMERAHAVQGSPIRSKGCFNCGDPGHMQSECPKPKRCKHCGKSGHVASDCWEKHPDKRPSKNTKDTGADPGKKSFPSKGKGKGKSKSKGKGKGKKGGKLRELEDEDEEGEWEFEDPEEGLVGDEDQVAMVVTSKSSKCEQTAMQGLHEYQVAAHAAADAARKGVALPSLQLCSDLPREWPMARLCISNKQVNRFVRTILWRRVAERALRGTSATSQPK